MNDPEGAFMTQSTSHASPSTHRKSIAVVGASTAGLFAAALLAEKGLSVRVYEANGSFNALPRTLIVTSRLSQVLGFVPTEAIVNQVHHIELISRGASARITLRKPDLIIERESLVRLLAERAQRAGVEMVSGQRFVGFDSAAAGMRKCVNNRLNKWWTSEQYDFVDATSDYQREEPADLVIGADGVRSQVAQAAAPKQRDSVALLQALVALPPNADPHTVRVWFERGDTRFFYWLIPESKERAAVGLIGEEAAEAEERLARFLGAQGFEPLEYQAAPVAVHRFSSRPWAEVGGSRVLLVGDAAGQVKMTTVGGAVAGLRGARAAVDAVLGRNSYRQELRELKRELDVQLLMRSILDRFTDADYDTLLHSLNRRIKDILETRNRDEMVRAFWSLPFAQPRLLSLALGVLLRKPGAAGTRR